MHRRGAVEGFVQIRNVDHAAIGVSSYIRPSSVPHAGEPLMNDARTVDGVDDPPQRVRARCLPVLLTDDAVLGNRRRSRRARTPRLRGRRASPDRSLPGLLVLHVHRRAEVTQGDRPRRLSDLHGERQELAQLDPMDPVRRAHLTH